MIKPGAPLQTLKKQHIVKTLFRTKRADAKRMKPKKLRFDLSRFAGRTLRLRFAEVDNQGELFAGADAVRLVQKKR